MNYLLDTCAISELIKPRPHPPVVEWLGSADESALFLSVLTIGELQKGVERLPDSAKKTQITDWIHRDLLIRFRERILTINPQIALTWGRIQAQAELNRQAMSVIDGLIAASALTYDWTVVTRNVADMKASGVKILNLWLP